MAEFQDVMRQWQRMCKSMQEKNMSCKEDCLLGNNLTCGQLEYASLKEINDAETVIMAWATKHPEPVYPTWWTYMCMIGVIPDMLGDKTLGEVTIESLMHAHIPADIAQKLDIEPKEVRDSG